MTERLICHRIRYSSQQSNGICKSPRDLRKKVLNQITTTGTPQNCDVDIVDSNNPRRSFNETSSNEFHRQLYQHQLSVPLYRQPSIPRRRRSSVIGRCDDHLILPIPITTRGGRQLHLSGAVDGGDETHNFADYLHIPYERRILSTSLNARDRVLRRCNQSEPLEFSIVYSENVLRHCRKIGEGRYGEVFMNKTINGDANVLKNNTNRRSIEVTGEPQKTFEQILSCKTDSTTQKRANNRQRRSSSVSSGFRLLDGDELDNTSSVSRNSIYRLKIDSMYADSS